jgi:threonine dehydrogenase-like Zn-dependent dehydrogenase
VILCDPQAHRRTRGEAFGATPQVALGELAAVVAQATQSYGADVAIDSAGASEAFELAFHSFWSAPFF